MATSPEVRLHTGQREAQAVQGLERREEAVLAALCREGHAWVGFQGLRRQLDLHQQILARTLKRLEAQGLVERAEVGYRLSPQGEAMLSGRGSCPSSKETLALAQTLLPPHVAAEAVVQHLQRRWFRGLRWYSLAEEPGETTLTWLAERGDAKVRVRISGGALALEAEAGPADKATFAAARPVLAAVAELYGLPGNEGGAATAMGWGPGVAA